MTTEIWTMLYWPQAKKKRLLCPSQWHCSQVTRLSDSDVFQHRLIIQSHILDTHDACILFTQNFFFSYAKLGLKAQVSIIGGVLPGFVTGTGTFFTEYAWQDYVSWNLPYTHMYLMCFCIFGLYISPPPSCNGAECTHNTTIVIVPVARVSKIHNNNGIQ